MTCTYGHRLHLVFSSDSLLITYLDLTKQKMTESKLRLGLNSRVCLAKNRPQNDCVSVVSYIVSIRHCCKKQHCERGNEEASTYWKGTTKQERTRKYGDSPPRNTPVH